MVDANPAKNLVGQAILGGEWIVEKAIDLKQQGSSGGFFCIPYEIRHRDTGQRAFLKVLDVVSAIQRYSDQGMGVAEALSRLGSAHLFETRLMETCKANRCTRIVRALQSGEIVLTVGGFGPVGFPFLILELGDGDTYRFIASGALDYAWWFSMLHQATVGIRQLHRIGIAHQDVKPSNVVFFGVDNAKIADLGRAALRGVDSLNDGRAGDSRYMPPEYLYGFAPTDWSERFLAMDLYLLGSLAFTGVARVPLTTLILSEMPPALGPTRFRGNFVDVVPALTKALTDVLEKARSSIPTPLQDIFLLTVGQLCHADPAKRGHPSDHRVGVGSKFSLERYVSAFRRMSEIALAELQ